MNRFALALVLVAACGKNEDPQPTQKASAPAAERETNAEIDALERQAAEIDALVTDLNKRLETTLAELKTAQSDADRERLKSLVDKLVGEKVTLDKRVEALDAAVKARAQRTPPL